MPVNLDDNGVEYEEDSEAKEDKHEEIDDEAEETPYKKSADSFHVSQKAIGKYGTIDGCPACRAIQRRGNGVGRIGYNHSKECRERVMDAMQNDPEYRQLAKKTRPEVHVIRRHVQRAIDHITNTEVLRQNNLGTQLDRMMLNMLTTKMQVAEIYSPPRVVAMANKMGLSRGWSLDLTTQDENGVAWDFNKIHMRNKAVRKLLTDQPLVSIGSPMCTAYSIMNRVNYSRMPAEEVQARLAYAKTHLDFCVKLYEMQWRAGRYFLHEHPDGAGSWQEDSMQRLMRRQGVMIVVGDQCRYGLVSQDKQREGPARKRTGFLTNAVCVARRLCNKCPNQAGYVVHRHVILENGRTKVAQIYPDELCREICKGIQEQVEVDRKGQHLLAQVSADDGDTTEQLMNVAKGLVQKYRTVEEDNEAEMEKAWDDVSGAELNPEMVKKARSEEIEYVRKMRLYDKVPISECKQVTGKSPIIVRWIDINKGDKEQPNYRSRVVAREINTHKREDLFAAIPPLEALKVILSMATSGNKGETIMINDISRAFFHAPTKRKVYVQLPREDQQPGEEHLCGRLNFSM